MPEQNELIKRRLEELEEIKKLGINPYPYSFDVTKTSAEILSSFKDPPSDEEKEKQKLNVVSVAGRLMAIRRMGKASFCHIKDESGRIQIYIRKDDVGDKLYEMFRLLDIGDIIGVNGFVFRTKMGEVSVHATELVLLSKSIFPLPVVKEEITESGEKKIYDAFADVELRYRQRYIDLIVNENVRETFIKRTKIIQSIKRTLEHNSFFEVETPTLQTNYGGANAKPFITHHHSLDIPELASRGFLPGQMACVLCLLLLRGSVLPLSSANGYDTVEIKHPLAGAVMPLNMPAPAVLWATNVPGVVHWSATFKTGSRSWSFDEVQPMWRPPETAWSEMKRAAKDSASALRGFVALGCSVVQATFPGDQTLRPSPRTSLQ